jgi:ACS family tartrate transporter-like MFS transporter
MSPLPLSAPSPLDRARTKAYWHLLPILFIAYVIAFVDRANVAFAKLTMTKDLPGFDNSVIGFGAGVFFIGYFLLEIPGSVIVEKWGARLWISRIMVTWGIMAAMTAFVHCRIPGFTHVAEMLKAGIIAGFRPLAGLDVTGLAWLGRLASDLVKELGGPDGLTIFQFYLVRFLLGLAEAGFFPGVVVFLSHWFPARDRGRALAFFFMATPVAQIIGPPLSAMMLNIGMTETVNGVAVHHPLVLGMKGWQWVYVSWGVPAVILGIVVLWFLPDRPKRARWLKPEECEALEAELARDKPKEKTHMSLWQGLKHPKVLALSFAYFCTVTGSYGVVFFLPSILDSWYKLKYSQLAWLSTLPALMALAGQLFVGWNSDRTKERRWHTVLPIVIGAAAVAVVAPFTRGNLTLTIICFMLALGGLKAYLPAFWTLPHMFLTSTAAAASVGMINSIGNLGGQLGPYVLGKVETVTGSFVGGLYFLAGSMMVCATVVFFLGLGAKAKAPPANS